MEIKPRSNLKQKRRQVISSVKGPGQRAIKASLTSLTKKVLDKSENPKNSLCAAILHSHQNDASDLFNPQRELRDAISSQPVTIYTPRLEGKTICYFHFHIKYM